MQTPTPVGNPTEDLTKGSMVSFATGIERNEIEVPKSKILVVDDNVETLKSMVAVLETLQEEVLVASSANEALKHLLKVDPAVIVLDVMMPDMDGFQLASLIRQRDRFRYTPIIFLTGLGKEDRQMLQGYQSGGVDYILKPCDPDVLRYKVKVFVDLARKNEMLRQYAQLMRAKSEQLKDALESTLKANAELEREIAERRRAEMSRDRLAGQLGATPDFVSAMAEGAVTLALDGSILYCNARFAEMCEREPASLVGAPAINCIASEFHATFLALLEESQNGRLTAEIELQTANGTKIPVQVALNAFQSTELRAIAMVVTDLRDQKRNARMYAEGKLARLLLEHSQPAMLVCDIDGRVTLASSTAQQLCDCNPLFRNFDEIFKLRIPGEESGPHFSIRDALDGQAYNSVEVELVRNDRSIVPLLLSASGIPNGEGMIGAVVTLVDISERKIMEEALRRSEKLAAAGRIAGTLAHEINNPLSAVTNLIFLLQNSDLEDSARTYAEIAASELSRVSHIVRNTLSFYREAAQPVAVKMPEVLDSVISMYSQQCADRGLEISRRYQFDGDVYGYPGELRQIFSNVIGNAIDALPEHGKLVVGVSGCSSHPSGQRGVRVTIADNGVGIPVANRARLFEPFFTTKGERGTGLGLWVTQGIIHKQGGTIRFRSSVETGRSGTVFSIFIPSASHKLHGAAGLRPTRPVSDVVA